MLIFSSAFNGFDRVWYQNLACHLSILFMSTLNAPVHLSQIIRLGNSLTGTIARQITALANCFGRRKKFISRQRFNKNTKKRKEIENQLMSIAF